MESTIIKVVFTPDGKVMLEGLEDLIKPLIEAEIRRLASPVLRSDDFRQDTKESSAIGTRPERELIAEKRPRNQTETVAVLAFSLAENGHAEFTEADIRRAYIRAGVRPPKVIAQAVRDAKNNFDFIECGSKRGTYRLSPHGDRTVRFDLPRSDS